VADEMGAMGFSPGSFGTLAHALLFQNGSAPTATGVLSPDLSTFSVMRFSAYLPLLSSQGKTLMG
jgi:hypothetical protein